MKVSEIEGKKMTAGRIGFGIGPRLNAAGRIQHARRLLSSSSEMTKISAIVWLKN